MHTGSGYADPVHDENYKKLFAFPHMVEDLVRTLVPGDQLGEFDFSTLEKLSSEYVSDELRKRRGDTVWRVRLRDGWLHVLVLLEFQSTEDPDTTTPSGISSEKGWRCRAPRRRLSQGFSACRPIRGGSRALRT